MVRSTPAMTLVDAVTSRFSVRGFLPEPVPRDILEQVFELAQQSPSNCNTQPWKAFVASGELKERLRQKFLDRQQQGIPGTPDFGYNSGFAGEYRKRQVDCAVALYNEMGIARDDKDGRSWAVRRNFEFFDAPPHRLPRHGPEFRCHHRPRRRYLCPDPDAHPAGVRHQFLRHGQHAGLPGFGARGLRP
ncbi:nitroreductase family protein [Pseudomonas asiatica]